ncbi:MAG: hypothetical protein IJ896_14875 [Fibrobacter sp.]|nr:hypothetical protein [Fibrobacter sp.]
MMFYKHWKKIALALTGFFWVSCDDSVSSEECLYGTPTNYDISSESGNVDGGSSSSAKAASSESAKSSSSKQKEVSSSSGGEEPQGIVACYDVSSDRQTLVRQQNNGITFLSCDDGTTCQEKVIEADVTAPDCEVTDCHNWDPPTVRDTVYYCINGEDTKIYTPEEFRERYTKVKEDVESSSGSFDAPITAYGPPCYFSGTCDTEEDN